MPIFRPSPIKCATVLLLLVGSLVGLAYYRVLTLVPRYRAALISLLGKTFPTSEISVGTLSLEIFPAFALRAENVQLSRGGPNSGDVLRIETLRLPCSLWMSLTGSAAIRRIELLKPHFSVLRESTHHWQIGGIDGHLSERGLRGKGIDLSYLRVLLRLGEDGSSVINSAITADTGLSTLTITDGSACVHSDFLRSTCAFRVTGVEGTVDDFGEPGHFHLDISATGYGRVSRNLRVNGRLSTSDTEPSSEISLEGRFLEARLLSRAIASFWGHDPMLDLSNFFYSYLRVVTTQGRHQISSVLNISETIARYSNILLKAGGEDLDLHIENLPVPAYPGDVAKFGVRQGVNKIDGSISFDSNRRVLVSAATNLIDLAYAMKFFPALDVLRLSGGLACQIELEAEPLACASVQLGALSYSLQCTFTNVRVSLPAYVHGLSHRQCLYESSPAYVSVLSGSIEFRKDEPPRIYLTASGEGIEYAFDSRQGLGDAPATCLVSGSESFPCIRKIAAAISPDFADLVDSLPEALQQLTGTHL